MPALWAMAAGVPVVAPETPSISGVIEGDASGLLYAPDDVHGAAARLLQVHARTREAARLGGSARAVVERRFGIAAFAARLEAAYEQCAKGEPIHVPGVAAHDPAGRELAAATRVADGGS